MDNHPIPQDVTGFQFKLIGSMTVKQFSYVAFGVILAVILYYLPLSEPFGVLIKIIFIPLFGGIGLAVAFLPIEGRPVDVMLGNFLKSFITPNQYIYHKTAHTFNFTRGTGTHPLVTKKPANDSTYQDKQKRLQSLLQSSHSDSNKLDDKEQTFLQSVTKPQVVPQAIPKALPAVEKPTPQLLAQQEKILTEQLTQAKQEEKNQQQPAAQSAAHQKATLLEKQIQTLHAQRQQLDKELTALQQQLSGAHQAQAPALANPIQPSSTPSAQPNTAQPQNIQEITKNAGLPHVPDVPNIIVGIVRDPRGNVLPNMLVEVKDKDGNPVRAFKTNMLGQFASATPLAMGVYTIELEDPKKLHSFDIIQVNADNQILLPIEIASHDAREELRKQLFN